jgi:multidrug efflux pump subunit AcrA (membrane-fusion protein)
VLWIVGSIIWGKREKPIPVTTETAIRKTIVQTVSATGKIQPEVEVKISPEVAGEIIELPVDDGMQVKKGDLLLKIKPDSYKALVEQQEAAISAAKATNLQQKATMMKTEHDLKRAEDLFNKKLISEQEYNAGQAAFQDYDLFTAGRNDHRLKQQTRGTFGCHRAICRHRSDARSGPHPHAGYCRCE